LNETQEHARRLKPEGPSRRKTDRRRAPSTSDLAAELDEVRERERTLTEKFEAVQEELTSSNEELQATNEEYQLTNEELETAKEELQASNEELISANAELETRNIELSAANESLRRGENRFRLMVECVKEYAIYMLDPEGRVASWNEGARRLKGYEAKEILGARFETFFPADAVAAGAPQAELEQARQEGRFEGEGWRRRKDGSVFWASVVLTRIDDPHGQLLGFTKVTRDLTDRKKAEEELRRSNEQLEKRVQTRTAELERALKARDEFLSIASHELKTPLTALKLKLQLARRGASLATHTTPAEAVQGFDAALAQLGKLEDLIEDLLDISRIQTGQLELERGEVDVLALAQEVVGRFKELAALASTPIRLVHDGPVWAQWDGRRVEQVLSNLLANALKYAPGQEVTLGLEAVANQVRLWVQDSGPGIAPEKQASLFERFERAGASPSVGGLGLGLFIARRIVEAHQGKIWVESAPGQGARFLVQLPRG
jgi:PAS domain S-box-containing protein